MTFPVLEDRAEVVYQRLHMSTKRTVVAEGTDDNAGNSGAVRVRAGDARHDGQYLRTAARSLRKLALSPTQLPRPAPLSLKCWRPYGLPHVLSLPFIEIVICREIRMWWNTSKPWERS